MRSIAIINQKGGVGKTTTAVNLAAALSESGQRVCILDLDPQAHASLHLGLAAADGDSSIYRVLTGDASLAEVRQKVCENLWVVPAHIDLAAVEMELANTAGREAILHKKLAVDDAPLDYLITRLSAFAGGLDAQRAHRRAGDRVAASTALPGSARIEQIASDDRPCGQADESGAPSDGRRAVHVRKRNSFGG